MAKATAGGVCTGNGCEAGAKRPLRTRVFGDRCGGPRGEAVTGRLSGRAGGARDVAGGRARGAGAGPARRASGDAEARSAEGMPARPCPERLTGHTSRTSEAGRGAKPMTRLVSRLGQIAAGLADLTSRVATHNRVSARGRRASGHPLAATACGRTAVAGHRPLYAADRVQAHSYGLASDRGTRGDGAGRRGHPRARARRLVLGDAQPGRRPPWGARGRQQHRSAGIGGSGTWRGPPATGEARNTVDSRPFLGS